MAEIKSANVTKYDNGGSGDNYIADGYIKSVEKIWSDSYSLATAVIGSDDSLNIGRIPKNKKLHEVIVYTPSLLAATSTCTIFIGSNATFLMTTGSCFLGAMQADGVAAGTETYDCNVEQTLRLVGSGMAKVMTEDTELFLKVVISGGVDSAVTGTTIRSIIKYS